MNDQGKIDALKQLIRKQIAEVKDDKPVSMHEAGVALAKAASASLKALDALKNKAKMPSRKAEAAIEIHLGALEELFNHMWQFPLDYLDSTPDEVVDQRRAALDDREASLMDGMNETVVTAEMPGVLVQPTVCSVCGENYDKKVHEKCPRCEMDPKDVKMWIENLKSTRAKKS